MRRQPDGAAQPADAPLQEAAFVPTQDTSDGHPASVPAAWMECPLPPRSSALPQPPSCGPEDDAQLQLALSLSREEHDKVRAASPTTRLP